MNNAFNLLEFGHRKVSKAHLLDSDGNIIPFETQLAIVTHYLQNDDTQYETTYKGNAQLIIQHWLKLLNK